MSTESLEVVKAALAEFQSWSENRLACSVAEADAAVERLADRIVARLSIPEPAKERTLPDWPIGWGVGQPFAGHSVTVRSENVELTMWDDGEFGVQFLEGRESNNIIEADAMRCVIQTLDFLAVQTRASAPTAPRETEG